MQLTNLIRIKGYAAGQNGNMLVSLDDKLVQDMKWPTKRQPKQVKMMITTAYVDDPATREFLRQYTDGNSPTDRIIVVNHDFTLLFNKTKLILLNNENAKRDVEYTVSCDSEAESYGHITTMAQYGRIRSKMAFDKARRKRELSEMAISGPYRRYMKKAVGQIAAGNDTQQDSSTPSMDDIMKMAENIAREMAENVSVDQDDVEVVTP